MFRIPHFLVVIFVFALLSACISSPDKIGNEPNKNEISDDENAARTAAYNYLTAVKEQKGEDAFALLDPKRLPKKENFIKSILKDPGLTNFDIAGVTKIDDDTYVAKTNIQIGEFTDEINFTLKRNGSNWLVWLDILDSEI